MTATLTPPDFLPGHDRDRANSPSREVDLGARAGTPTKVLRSCRTCGWKGSYDSAARADYAKSRHSCARWIEKARRAENGARIMAERAKIDRTPKPCHHPETTHEHGTHACYVLDSCRCIPCSKANSDYESDRGRRNAYGRSNYVDATASREHITTLTEQGMGLKRIAQVSDVSHGLLWKLMYGKTKADGTRTPSKRVRRDTEQRILRIELNLAGGAKVASNGTRRRLQALVAIGYSQASLAARLGMQPGNFGRTLHHNSEVLKSTADAVLDLYDDLSMTPVEPVEWRAKISASRARRYAAWMMWLPPLAWDDDTIDDPFAELAPVEVTGALDDIAIERRIAGDKTVDLTFDERFEAVRRMHAAGALDTTIANTLGVSGATTRSIRDELELEANERQSVHVIDPDHFGAAGDKRRREERTSA